MNKEQQTIAAIQKAVPDIMEVKRGCKVLDADGEIYDISSYIFPPCEWKINQHLIKKIIGRPITLEDLFLTFLSLGFHYEIGEIGIAGMPKSGLCMVDIKKNRKVMCIVSWELNIPYHLQSKETKELIGDLICKE